MKSFAYTAYSSDGKRKRGTVVAQSEAEASAQITALGLMPGEITAQTTAAPAPRWQRERRIDPDTLAVFTRQLAVLLDAGLPIETALEAVQSAAGSAKIERLAAQARAGIMAGDPLANALAKAGGALPPWYAAAVHAGEGAGNLDGVFETLATHLETTAAERATITSALVYPVFVTLVAIAVCAILMTTVAPEIIGLFEATGRPLPALTTGVMAIVDGVRDNWPVVLGGIVLFALAIFAINRHARLRARRDAVLLKTPLIGRFIRMSAAAQYLRTLALVINSRLPLTEALRFAAGVVEVAQYRQQAETAGTALQQGQSLSTALSGLTFLNPVAQQLLQAGEASARLGPMSERAAVLAETWLRTERKRLSVIVEPASMMIVGAMVLTIVLAILLPIFDMQALVTP